jgi:Protein kinase domain
MVGSQIGNYNILEKLGEGGMGVVYKAVDVNLDRVVAIKALNTELTGNAELEQRFRAEAKAQANLNHTNLATLYALLIEGGRPWMVMEFIEGETFEQMVQRRGPVPSTEAIPLFRQALLGLGYAHRTGIVHRDIKPSNIMVNKQGIVKVMDFGIAKVLGARGMTRTGTQMGTAFYMSPEQVLNRGVDIRSDIYSLGVTLYEILTANVPFNGDSDYQIMTDHVNTPPPLLTKFYPYVPKGVENAVLKAISKKQDERFQTVEEFGSALEHPNDFGVVLGAGAPAVIPARAGATVIETPGHAPIAAATSAHAYTPQIVVQTVTGGPHETPAARPFWSREIKIAAIGILAVSLMAGAWMASRSSNKPAPLPILQTSGNGSGPVPGGDAGQVTPLGSSTPVPVDGGQRGQTPPQGGQSAPNRPTPPQAPPPAAHASLIPVGTGIVVRMIDSVDSSRDNPGASFQASVDEPVFVGSLMAIPRGASARVALANVAQAGHIEGRSEVRLHLISLNIHGRSYPVRSAFFEKVGASRGQRSAEVIGGSAAAGAVLGGILGHGKGAAIGAAAGAGAGTTVQMATKGASVFIPSETRIDFVLRGPIVLAQ